MISRRQFFIGVGAAGAAMAVPLVAGLSIVRSRHKVALWRDGGPMVRIGHLSDFHSSTYISLAHIRNSIDMVLEEKPDIVCLTGDFVNAHAPDPAGLVAELKRLSSSTPVYSCLGNHDGGRWLETRKGPATPDAVIEILHAAGIITLRDQTEQITIRDRKLLLTGVNDLWSETINPKRAGFTGESTTRIVLAHNPDTKDELKNEKWNLMLSGHTHGGQIRLPFFGGRLTAPVRDDRYIEGLLPWGERQIHITRGVGALYGLRINCPPEVSLLDLA